MALISNSSTSANPVTVLKNTNADANGAILQFQKDGASAASGDSGGLIQWVIEDAGGDTPIVSQINGVISDATDGAEDGGLTMDVLVAGSLTTLVDVGKKVVNEVGIGGGASATPLAFYEPSGGGSSKISFVSPALAADLAFTLPNADGSSGYALITNGSKTLSWGAISGISGLGSTDNVLLRANGTGGNAAQGSSILIDDSDNMSAVGTLGTTGAVTIAAAGGLAGLGAGGNEFSITESSDDVTLATLISDKDMIFKVNDGGSATEVFRLNGDDASILMGTTNKITFHDTSQFIHASSNAILELGATDEIGLTATLVDMDANLDLDGTANVSGLVTVQTGIVPDAQDGAYLGTTSLQWSDLYMADAAVIGFGDDNEITLTHVHDQGLTLASVATTDPVFEIKNTNADATGGALKFTKDGTSVADNDVIGNITFVSEDDGDNAHTYASIYGKVVDMTGGSEEGSMVFSVAEVDGTLTAGMELIGHASTDGKVSLLPAADAIHDLGSTAKRWANIYTSDMNFANERGDWTLIEENDYISFRNNNTGRRFRMLMEDITDSGDFGPDINGTM